MSVVMRPGLASEQVEIGRTMQAFLADHSPEPEVRRIMLTERGFDDGIWAMLAELGIPGLLIGAEHGGLGLGITELSLVMEAAGAALLCAPLLSSSVLSTSLIQRCADDSARADLLPALASGSRRAAAALGESGATGTDLAPTATARQSAGVWMLSGTCRFVLDGHTADDILVAARVPAGVGLFVVDAAAAGVQRAPMRTLDLTRKQATLTFAEVRARPLAVGPAAAEAIAAVLDTVRVLLAAEQVGGATACLQAAAGYAKTRVQFGRLIGSFQAIKHLCANMLITLEGARATMIDAVRVSAAPAAADSSLALAASLCKIACSDGYFTIASDALHVHGGIGFTWEQSSHLHFRRAKSSQLMFGSPGRHRTRLLDVAGLARHQDAANAGAA
jgi:alkylation response protein AidB-like acyl-CoA dehydrogenase